MDEIDCLLKCMGLLQLFLPPSVRREVKGLSELLLFFFFFLFFILIFGWTSWLSDLDLIGNTSSRQLKSSNVELGSYLDGRLPFKCCLKSTRFDYPYVPFPGCWLCVDAELAIGGQCSQLGPCTRNPLWSEQPLAPNSQTMGWKAR